MPRCSYCGRNFQTASGLRKHNAMVKRNMAKGYKGKSAHYSKSNGGSSYTKKYTKKRWY